VNGELAHAIAVIAQGSVWLRGGGSLPDVAGEPAFPFVREVRFTGPGDEQHDAGGWLTELRRNDVQRIWLLLEQRPPAPIGEWHQLAGFVGAGNWTLLAGNGVWRADWKVGWPDAPDRRIWRVTYRGSEVEPIDAPRPDLAKAEEGLRSILVDARDFCRVEDEPGWADHFENALHADGASRPLPAGYGPDAQRLLELADRSWVFGGMGSFNDLGFQTDTANRAYELVSATLYRRVLAACVAATNSAFVSARAA
jgi:hypothetical protein